MIAAEYEADEDQPWSPGARPQAAPLSARQLTSVPGALDEPRTPGQASASARRMAELLARPCPHYDQAGRRISCSQAEDEGQPS